MNIGKSNLRCIVLSSIVILSCGCKASSTQELPFKPIASLHGMMVNIIDPAVDEVWESVSTTVSADGIEENKPVTDEDWQRVRGSALRLVEASNLLLIKGRSVVNAGEVTSDTDTEGVNDADEIAQAINRNFEAFTANTLAFRSASEKVLDAIEKKDVALLEQAGGDIEHSCEGCHTAFWYPNAAKPDFSAVTAGNK